MHHYAHHIGDYRAHTAHLTMLEDGAFRRLLDLYYMHEKALPASVAACQRLTAARTDEERAAVATILEEFFTLEADGWHQSRADREIETYHGKAAIARENGKGGGRPKTQKKPRNNPAGFLLVPESNLSETVTKNQEPLTNNQREEGGAVAPCASEDAEIAFAEFMKAAGDCGWPKPRGLEADRRKKLKARLAEHGLDGWRKAIAIARESEFLRTKFPLKFDWVLESKNLRKVLEGNYGQAEAAAARPVPSREDDVQWNARLRGWRPGKFWNRGDWGPDPTEPGCRAPASVLTHWQREAMQ
jgi:uncharacterized protein YdaU (DUF1376 family)